MNILVFGASLRKGSYNKKLAAQAAEILRARPGVSVDLADFREFGMPVYDGDIEDADGIPPGAQKLIDRIRAADAVIISSPEYNGGMPGAFKNAVDWVSRDDDNPLDGKPVLLIGASPGALGAIRGLWHGRQPLEAMGTLLYPTMFGLARANQAFTETGALADPKQRERLESLIGDFLSYAGKFAANR